MGQYATHRIEFQGNAVEVKKVVDYLKSKAAGNVKFSYGFIIPEPKGLSVREITPWRRDNWGETYDAEYGEIDDAENTITFWTKTPPPLTMLRNISNMLFQVILDYKFAHEAIGERAGHYIFENGLECKSHQFGSRSPAAVKLGLELWYGNDHEDERLEAGFDENYRQIENPDNTQDERN